MKRSSVYLVLLGIVVVWLTVPMRLMAGQIITPEVREWAKEVISQEGALGTIEGERTIAVLRRYILFTPANRHGSDDRYGFG